MLPAFLKVTVSAESLCTSPADVKSLDTRGLILGNVGRQCHTCRVQRLASQENAWSWGYLFSGIFALRMLEFSAHRYGAIDL